MTPSLPAIMRRAALSTLCAILAAALNATRAAGADEIRVLSSGAPADVAKRLAAKFADESGHRIPFTVANPAAIQHKLAAGETPDIVILPAPIIEALAKSGPLLAGSRVDLARVGVGVAVREGAPHPEISTATRCEMLTDALDRRSRSRRRRTDRSRARAHDRPEARPRSSSRSHAPAGDAGVALVADGAAEIGLFNISEVLPVGGVTLVGPPPKLQSYIVFAAAIHARSPLAGAGAGLDRGHG